MMIRPEELLLDQTAPLGATRTGTVYKGTWNQTGLVSVKIFSLETSFTALKDYVDRLGKLKHPNVLDIYGLSSEDADPFFLVTSFQPEGNVRQFLGRNPNADRPKIALDTALGMLFLHSVGIPFVLFPFSSILQRGLIHGSLSPNNILMREDGRACVADCGIVELQASNNKEVHRYFSPEAWKGTVSRPSDVFAFAMCAFEIFTSSPPWGVLSENRVFQLVVQENSRPDCPARELRIRVGFTDHLWGVLEECWHKESRLRPSFDHIVRLWHASESHLQRVNSRPRKALPVPPTQHPSSHARSRSSSLPERHRDGNLRLIPSQSRAYNPSIRSVPRRVPTDEPGSAASTTFESSFSSTGSSSDHSLMPMTPPSAKSSTGDIHPYVISPGWESSTSLDVPTARGLPAIPLSPPPLPMSPPPMSRSIKSRKTAPSLSDWDRSYTRSVDARSVQSDDRTSTLTGTSCVLIVGALQSEVNNGHHLTMPEIVDTHLLRVQYLALQSNKFVQKLVTAGIVPIVISLLKSRAGTGVGLEQALISLGVLTHDNLTSNTILRTGTVPILLEIFTSSTSENVASLALWCLTRLCRSIESASTLMKTNIVKLILHSGLSSSPLIARSAAWCLGSLVWTDGIADSMAELNTIPAIVDYLSRVTSKDSEPEDICAGLFAVARISRSIKLAKTLARVGVVPIIAKQLRSGTHPEILNWSARVVGCMMRPNSSDIAKILLDAGVATGLARLPSILPSEDVEPLGSLAFSVQRFSAAEWSGKIRQRLVDAGVVDALLAAIRTAADEPFPQVHIDLALAISSLADVGGSAVRKEIINAGGVAILKKVASDGSSAEVGRACSLAITSITGNLLTRNAASAKTALAHTWSGGCPDYQPSCPVAMVELDMAEEPASASFLAMG